MTMRVDYQHAAPHGVKALGGVYMYIAGCGLPEELVNLVYLRASQINGCAYCIDSHSRDLLRGGLKAEKLMLVSAWHEAEATFSDKECAAFAWTEAVTLVATSRVPDDVFDAARVQFSEKELADLTIAIGLINAYNRIAISFRRGPEASL
jgi:AhpD family alkylhydroperoxidase